MKKIILLMAIFILIVPATAFAQEEEPTQAPPPTEVQCGDVLEGEFVEGAYRSELKLYMLQAEPGTLVKLVGEVPGDTLYMTFFVLDPLGQKVAEATHPEGESGWSQSPVLESPRLPTRGEYIIGVVNGPYNTNFPGMVAEGVVAFDNSYGSAATGIYYMSIECTLPDGSVLSLSSGGAAAVPGQTVSIPNTFPAALVPLSPDVSNTVAVIPGSTDLIGYTLEAPASSEILLNLARVNGNAYSGTVVLSPAGEIVFAVIMTNTISINAQVEALTEGQYVVIVYPLTFAQPENAGATVIQFQARLKE